MNESKLTFGMNTVTEALIRRAASQAVSLARQNCRALYTNPPQRAPEANIIAEMPASAQEDVQKTIHDLPGPNGYPILGTAPEYFRKPNRGQMHEVQVSLLILLSIHWVISNLQLVLLR